MSEEPDISAGAAAAPHTPLWLRARRRFVYLVWNQMLKTEHPAWERFFARRCPHLAGMIAYFGVLSIIPAAFLFISALAFAGLLENQGWIVHQLQDAIPAGAGNAILKTVTQLRNNSGSLGAIGIFGVVWSTMNFFSCIETGLNIIYGVNNRHFLFQKIWVLFLMVIALIALVLITLGVAVALPVLHQIDDVAQRHIDLPFDSNSWSTFGVSLLFAFFFFLSCYRFLPNTTVSTRDCWRGAVIATVAFEISIHLLPTWLSVNHGGVVISAFAGAFIVLVWFYLMAYVLLIGGVYNWWHAEKLRRLNLLENAAAPLPAVDPLAAG